jgi:hypothetical protein
MTFEDHIKQALGQLAWEALQARAKNDALQKRCDDLGKALVEQEAAFKQKLVEIHQPPPVLQEVTNDTDGDRG